MGRRGSCYVMQTQVLETDTVRTGNVYYITSVLLMVLIYEVEQLNMLL